MLSQWFVHPGLLAGLGLVTLPIIIHLIHRLRFKRVRWAAMEFLLDSQRRNRRRLLLEHLLLLLLRCALIALVVFVVARPETSGRLGEWLAGEGKAEHIVILDDSMSMGQTARSLRAFDAARQAVDGLAGQLARRPGWNILTLLRTSSPSAPDLLAVAVDESVVARVTRLLAGLKASYLASSPTAAIAEAKRLLDETTATNRLVYILSDFQAKDWRPGADVYAALRELAATGASIQLVDAIKDASDNFAVIDLKPKAGSVASGVPFTIEATVKSFSGSPATRIAVSPRVDGQPLPTHWIDALSPGVAADSSFEVNLSSPGLHDVSVDIQEDGLAADNRRFLAVDVPSEVPVLIVDGSRDRRDSLYLALALAPGGGVNTGLAPQIRSIDALRGEDLQKYRAVYLLNVAAVDSRSAAKLTEYVRAGGGLAIFLGDQVDASKYNTELFRDGDGLLPVAIGVRRATKPLRPSAIPDMRPEDHPVFRVFAEERNSFLGAISIRELYEVREETLAKQSKVIARHRDGSPIAIERNVGDGRVILFLTTAGDAWNSWPRNPTYVVAMLLLNERLSESARPDASGLVGEPWTTRFAAAAFRRDVVVEGPGRNDQDPLRWTIEARIEESDLVAVFADTSTPGVYRMTRTATDGRSVHTGRAFNVPPAESDLQKATPRQLAESLSGVSYRFLLVEDFSGDVLERRFALKDWLLIVAAAVLLAEQFLGYHLGFHKS